MPLSFAGYGNQCRYVWDEKETLLLLYLIAEFVMEGIASANSVWDITSVAGARPGAFPSATAGPVRPARPVTVLLNSRSRDCKTLCTSTQGSDAEHTEFIFDSVVHSYLCVRLYQAWNSGRPSLGTGAGTDSGTSHPGGRECLRSDKAYTCTHYTLLCNLLWPSSG